MAKAKKSTAEEIADQLATPTERLPAVPDADLLSTGCTLLNVAISGRPFGAIPKGTYWSLVGASGSSKTWFSFCLFAEASRNPSFKGYTFIHDNAENGALMDLERYFGPHVKPRLKPPAKGKAGSESVEEFYHNVESAVNRGPCIYVLDSMDAIDAQAEVENYEAMHHFHETGKGESNIKGSMGTSKARANSKRLGRLANTVLRSNGSILVIISQTRDAINSHIPGLQTYGGGKALKFYSHVQTIGKTKAPIKRYYAGKDREVGVFISFDVTKNRVSGWESVVPPVPFLKEYGVDDVGANLNYLVDEKFWEGDNTSVVAPEFSFTGKKEKLIEIIQNENKEAELQKLVQKCWRAIIDGSTPKRKVRYT